MAPDHALAAAEAALQPHRRGDATPERAVDLDRVVDPEPAQQSLRIVVRHLVVGDVRVHLEGVHPGVAQASARQRDRERVRRLPGERAHDRARQLEPAPEQWRRNPSHDGAGGQGSDRSAQSAPRISARLPLENVPLAAPLACGEPVHRVRPLHLRRGAVHRRPAAKHGPDAGPDQPEDVLRRVPRRNGSRRTARLGELCGLPAGVCGGCVGWSGSSLCHTHQLARQPDHHAAPTAWTASPSAIAPASAPPAGRRALLPPAFA